MFPLHNREYNLSNLVLTEWLGAMCWGFGLFLNPDIFCVRPDYYWASKFTHTAPLPTPGRCKNGYTERSLFSPLRGTIGGLLTNSYLFLSTNIPKIWPHFLTWGINHVVNLQNHMKTIMAALRFRIYFILTGLQFSFRVTHPPFCHANGHCVNSATRYILIWSFSR